MRMIVGLPSTYSIGSFVPRTPPAPAARQKARRALRGAAWMQIIKGIWGWRPCPGSKVGLGRGTVWRFIQRTHELNQLVGHHFDELLIRRHAPHNLAQQAAASSLSAPWVPQQARGMEDARPSLAEDNRRIRRT